MEPFQKEFIEFALAKHVLRFGEFTLKSGRISPYFFNSGLFNDGETLAKLGHFYAAAIEHSDIDFDMLYGPAYKGIPLASAMSIALSDHFKKNMPFAFNRKEAKDHGEGGIIFGSKINGKALIVDDVISAGTSIRESIDIITQEGGTVAAAIVAVDRQEKGQGETSAIQEVEQQFGFSIISIINLEQIIAYITENSNSEIGQYLDSIKDYKQRYGTIST